MIGVLGMVLFSATDGAFVCFVQKFVNGMTDCSTSRSTSESSDLLADSASARRCCSCCAASATTCRPIFPGYVGRQVIKSIRARPVPPVPAPARELLRPQCRAACCCRSSRTTSSRWPRPPPTPSPSLIRDTLTIVVLIGMMFYISWQLARVRVPDRAAAVVAGAQGVELVPPLQRAHPGVDGRRHARRQGSARRPARHQGLQRAGRRKPRDFEKVNEHNRRSNMKLIAARATSNPVVQFIASLALGGILLGGDAPDRQRARMALDDVHGLSHRAADDHRSRSSGSWIRSCRLQQGVAAGASVFEVLDAPVGGFQIRPRARPRLAAPWNFATCSFEYPAEKGGVLHSVSACGAGRQDHRDCRTLRQRQVHAGRAGAAHLRRQLPARCSSTASTCATATCATCAPTSRS